MGRRWLIVVFFFITLVALWFSSFGLDIYRLVFEPMDVQNNQSTILRIDKYTSASSFAHLLSSRHFIQSDKLLLRLIRMQGLANKLKAGIYQIKPGESAQDFLRRVVVGDVLVETFTIIAGTTEAQVTNHLKQADFLTYHAADWLPIQATHPNAEGLLLADTYHYNAGSDSKAVLELAHRHLQQFLESCWQRRSPNLPYQSSYELLIAASILEKEAALPEERRLIAGVIVNRLRKNMLLQMDPTVIYALGSRYKGKLAHEDLHIDSPYNSYRYRGLPPTPIAMVGKDAIEAAAHPLPTAYLYFVARGDGSHTFSVTYEEQKQAIARYLRKANGNK